MMNVGKEGRADVKKSERGKNEQRAEERRQKSAFNGKEDNCFGG